ncbi:MAG: inorganic diphosphatase [Candidatus Aenigmatarchaeota archaeon]
MPVDLWKNIPTGEDPPQKIYAVIEIPKGSKNKYEYDKNFEAYKLDRVLHSTVFYPGDYGLIPQTLYEDGDPLDILVLMDEATFPGCIISVRPIARINILDNNERDDKILAVPSEDPNFKGIDGKTDISPHRLKEIAQFFRTYKLLEEGKETEVLGWEDRERAYEAIKKSMELFKEEIDE